MARQKPNKPRSDFPLFAHASGQWAKTMGQPIYFGPWEKPEQALEKYNREKDDLYAGREPDRGDGVRLVQLVNHFLTSKKRLVASRELETVRL